MSLSCKFYVSVFLLLVSHGFIIGLSQEEMLSIMEGAIISATKDAMSDMGSRKPCLLFGASLWSERVVKSFIDKSQDKYFESDNVLVQQHLIERKPLYHFDIKVDRYPGINLLVIGILAKNKK